MHQIFAASEGIDLKTLSPAPKITDVGTLVNVIIRNAFTVAGVIFLFLLIFGGFGYIMAAGSGNSKGMEKGKQAITGAVVGLILVVLSASIVTIIGILTGTKPLGQ